jgi:orotate phosphoribosyltransferase
MPSAESGEPTSKLSGPYRDRLLTLLREKAYEKRDVILASGRRSNFYIDCRRVVLTAEGHFLTGMLFNEAIRAECPDVIAVGGLTLGADPLTSATSLMSFLGGRPLDAFYVRKEAKKHGTAQFVEGAAALASGTKVAILEDVVTTGGSSLKAVERAQAAGLEPVRVLALVDRCEGGRETIEQRLPLTSLFARTDFPE